MKLRYLTLFALSFLIFESCSNDDVTVPKEVESEETPNEDADADDTETEDVNSAPNAFELITIDSGSTDTELMPTLTWEAAVDPDEDAVTYNVYLDDQETPETLIAENITTAEFEITDPLNRETTYYWRVVASDDKEAETESTSVFNFTTKGLSFSESALVTSADFSARSEHSVIEFNDKLWLIGGTNGSTKLGGVWSSEDGKNWTLVAENPFDYLKKTNHSSLVYDNKLWVISSNFSDVWSSTNGVDWEMVTFQAAFGTRNGHASVVFDNKMWVIGGFSSGLDAKNDVWSSTDGITWTQEVANAQFAPRAEHTVSVLNGVMYLTGGTSVANSSPTFYNDVFTSTDGINWTALATETVFEPRSAHTSTVFDNKIWITGGWNAIMNEQTYVQDVASFNDVWSSADGITWTKSTTSESFEGRFNHAAVAFNNQLLIIGGQDILTYEVYGDIWVIE